MRRHRPTEVIDTVICARVTDTGEVQVWLLLRFGAHPHPPDRAAGVWDFSAEIQVTLDGDILRIVSNGTIIG